MKTVLTIALAILAIAVVVVIALAFLAALADYYSVTRPIEGTLLYFRTEQHCSTTDDKTSCTDSYYAMIREDSVDREYGAYATLGWPWFNSGDYIRCTLHGSGKAFRQSLSGCVKVTQ